MSHDIPPDVRDGGRASDRGRLAAPRARIGVILPSSNRLMEPQFQHYAPIGLGVHFSRARITGRWARPLAELAAEIVRAAETLADAKPDLLVFNCTATSMKEGPAGDAYLLDLIRKATGIEAISTAGAVVQALQALGLRRLTLATPYVQATNDHEKEFFSALGLVQKGPRPPSLMSHDAFQWNYTTWLDLGVAVALAVLFIVAHRAKKDGHGNMGHDHHAGHHDHSHHEPQPEHAS